MAPGRTGLPAGCRRLERGVLTLAMRPSARSALHSHCYPRPAPPLAINLIGRGVRRARDRMLGDAGRCAAIGAAASLPPPAGPAGPPQAGAVRLECALSAQRQDSRKRAIIQRANARTLINRLQVGNTHLQLHDSMAKTGHTLTRGLECECDRPGRAVSLRGD